MDAQNKIEILKDRLNKMAANEKENAGAQRKVQREIRNLEKTLALQGKEGYGKD